MPGPLQVIAVSFGPSADFEGRVLAEVDRLQGRGVLRLLDVLFVAIVSPPPVTVATFVRLDAALLATLTVSVIGG